MKAPPRYTMRFAFQKSCEGQGLWIALGNFLNSWFEDAKDHRYALVAEPLQGRLVATTPVEFRKRNIYRGDRMFDNKWELVERYRERIEAFKRLSKKELRAYYKTGKMPAK